MRRIYFSVPSVTSAKAIVDALLLARSRNSASTSSPARAPNWKIRPRPGWRSAAT